MSFKLHTFNRADRYRNYQDWSEDYINELNELASQSPWRNHYHIEPKTGLLNDPNGFSLYKGEWQLFYQYFPFGPVHGLKSWYRLTSKDLIHWEEGEIVLFPDSSLDSHGAYSGSAVSDGEDLRLFYTGNVRDKDWSRHPKQNTVTFNPDKGGLAEKRLIIDEIDQATDHFRDPMYFTAHGKSWLVIGGQRKTDEKGTLYLYQADPNDLAEWTFHSELSLAQADSAYMFECPNINHVDDKVFVTFCPQGIDQDQLKYQNIYPNAYLIADNFTADGQLENPGQLLNLDYGFDVYASQLINAPDGRVLGVSWLGLPEIDYPTDQFGYQGALSLVKEFRIHDGQLYQYPVAETLALRQAPQSFDDHIEVAENAYEYVFEVAANQEATVYLYADAAKNHFVSLSLSAIDGKITLDRSKMGTSYGTAFGTSRQLDLNKNQAITVNVFADESVLEIFVNGGAYAMSSRIFTASDQQKHIFAEGTDKNIIYPLRK
ncbi:sucrose-6-phosphate hydrolase [Aerococcaceae bacterium 50-4]